jgi:nitrogen regulatory protein P-II 1
MKEVKAFVHRARAADIVHALLQGGWRHLSLVDVRATLEAVTPEGADYSVELGESVVTEVKVEVVCEDADVDRVIAILRAEGRSRPPRGGST